jgi:hypothetical protein
MTICRLLLRYIFYLKVFIVFEILCKCNNEGEKNITRYIGYKFLGTPFTQTNVAYMHNVYVCCIFEDCNERMMSFLKRRFIANHIPEEVNYICFWKHMQRNF